MHWTSRFLRAVTLLLLSIASKYSLADGEFIGSASCQSCHAAEYQAWQGSHHDLAMQVASPETVLGDFDNAEFSYNGITTTFLRRGQDYLVRTDGEDGSLTEFPVRFVFGVEPLQQYLIPLSRGRLQALSIAWDSRPAEEGGQRWFHLYPDEQIDHQDPLHWTGPYQNWNSNCAECHSTNLRKNYDASSHSFDTQYSEINVSCEACHGPADKHVNLAETGQLSAAKYSGFAMSLAQRGEWSFKAGQAIAERRGAVQSNSQIDSCGRCHSRRGSLAEYQHGRPLSDTHRLTLPRAPQYYHDGQVLDENYVYASFLQSKMHQAGVVCSNCHEPHSLQLRAQNNGVCAQCHRADVYDQVSHHHHPSDSNGALCANCHMPETTYMVVDPRRDHSMRIPRPDLSLMLDTPNACTMCHQDRSDDWALGALRKWGVNFRDTSSHPARAFAGAANNDARAIPRLAELAADNTAAPIWRATAIEALADLGSDQQSLATAQSLLQSADPLLRSSAVNALQWLPLQQRYSLLAPLIQDPITSVRLAVAESLASVPLEQISQDQREPLLELFHEYQSIARRHADMPGTQVQLAIFLSNRGDLPAAEKAYREALQLNSQLLPARLNLADLLRSQGREDEARQQLLKALESAAEHGPSLHALGLLEIRQGEREKALDYLGRAAAVEEQGTRHRFVYAIALHDMGQVQEALRELETLQRQAPQNSDILAALVNYNAELGDTKRARHYAKELLKLEPNNPAFQRLWQSLPAN
ncbi:HEAT repeat domain-containing protein [Sediminihaliea albiluteola]|uniref:HEAT repeat domain-containing protein n=1 Tax=Sediminihaliea albiluteola TaxID=2758564 RepID=UPI002E28D9E7|nr:HEAT repeat domain-containing protein [Sediminihaliea albiluteola]